MTDSPATRTLATFTTRPVAALVACVTTNTGAAFLPAPMSFLSTQLTVSAALRAVHAQPLLLAATSSSPAGSRSTSVVEREAASVPLFRTVSL